MRRCGVRAVRQMMARSREDCEAFLEDWTPDPFMAVVKPLESAGSDDVYLCHSAEEVRDAFETIDGKVSRRGGWALRESGAIESRHSPEPIAALERKRRRDHSG